MAWHMAWQAWRIINACSMRQRRSCWREIGERKKHSNRLSYGRKAYQTRAYRAHRISNAIAPHTRMAYARMRACTSLNARTLRLARYLCAPSALCTLARRTLTRARLRWHAPPLARSAASIAAARNETASYGKASTSNSKRAWRRFEGGNKRGGSGSA